VRPLALAVLSLFGFVAFVVGVALTPLALVLVPLVVVAVYALAVRMPVGSVVDAVTTLEEDAGRGPAGMLP
jgi:hypothetical protein